MPTEALAVQRNTVLVVSSRIEDHASLQEIFRNTQWDLHGVWTAEDGLKTIRRRSLGVPVVVCEHTLPDGDWKLLLTELDKMSVRPRLVVCSRLADDRLWAEVLNWGAFDLLQSAPFVPEEVRWVTQSAWLEWNGEARPASRADWPASFAKPCGAWRQSVRRMRLA